MPRGQALHGRRTLDAPISYFFVSMRPSQHHSADHGGLTVSETTYAKGVTIPPHAHAHEGYFNVVLVGAFTDRVGRAEVSVGHGDVVFHPPGEMRANRFDAPMTTLFNVHLGVRELACFPQAARLGRRSVVFKDGPFLALAARLRAEMRSGDVLSVLVAEALAVEMIGEATRAPGGVAPTLPPRWLLRVRDVLHEEPASPGGLATLAALAGVHPFHLCRAFRRYFGCTMGDYVRRLRIHAASRRLASTSTPLVEIACDAGFADQSHFTRAFRRVTGMSPGRYRRALQP